MKFNNTLVKRDSSFWDLSLDDKWVNVVLESPVRIPYNTRKEMLCCMDYALSGYRTGAGNGDAFNQFIWDVAGLPEYSKNVFFKDKVISVYASLKEIKETYNVDSDTANVYSKQLAEILNNLYTRYIERVQVWQKNFKRFSSPSDANVFNVDLFSSSYIGGPNAFFDFKTGKIASHHSIGKYPEKISSVREELEAFARKYPDIPVYVTFVDGTEGDSIHTVATLLVSNSEVVEVKTRSWKQIKYVFKDEQKFCNLKYRLWRIWTDIYERIIANKEGFVRDNYQAEQLWQVDDCPGEQYFTLKQAKFLIEEYKENLRK